jgi:redox-sensing transcriptional repressor
MIEAMQHRLVPEPTVRRLSYYVVYLQELYEKGLHTISSTQIADELSFDPTQVRKDLQYTGIMGQPKIGFDIAPTIQAIKACLHWQECEGAFLVGSGNLGKAIMNYDGIKDLGIRFVAAFDNDPMKIGSFINGIEILDIERLPVLAKIMKVKVAVLAAPVEEAQECADFIIKSGINAIWNLLPCRIKAPENIIIEEAHMLQSLAVLTSKLASFKKFLN